MTTPLLSAGIVPVYQTSQERRYLLLRAYNYWDFPKGLVERSEDVFEAARRELAEEAGIRRMEFPWGEEFIETEPYSKGKVARYYVGCVLTDAVSLLPNPVHGKVEHHEYRWCTFEEGIQLVVPRVRRVLEWAHEKAGK